MRIRVVLCVYCVGYAVELTLSEQFWEEDELRVNATWSVSPSVAGALPLCPQPPILLLNYEHLYTHLSLYKYEVTR